MEKMYITKELKKFLEIQGFYEVSTPVLRKDIGKVIRRIKVAGEMALRDSHELQLRYLLSEKNAVYEIGSCFREEEEDKKQTNAKEFLLMELFTTKHDLKALMELIKEFIVKYKENVVFTEISIAEYIKRDLGLDLFSDSQDLLYEKLKKVYPSKPWGNYKYVEQYIRDYIEPLSKNKVVFFTEYPECTCSYADILQGNVIKRFELFADGIELANGFDDECNSERFMQRNAEIPLFSKEEKCIAECLEKGILPSKSSGVGIGIDRLCMFFYGKNDINEFSFPADIF